MNDSVIPDLRRQLTDANNYKNSSESDIIKEVEERLMKKNNIILYEVVDKNNIQDDFKSISNILAKIDLIVNIKNFSRLGKYDDKAEKPRPLLIKLGSSDEVASVFKNRKLFTNIKIGNDRTKKQRDLYKKASIELNSRTNDGEENLFIKNINGIPTVIENNKNNNKRKANNDDTPESLIDLDVNVNLNKKSKNSESTTKMSEV